MSKIIVLGAGLIGKTITKDLAENYHVTVVDIDEEKLRIADDSDNIFMQQADLSDAAKIKDLVEDYDLVIGAVPGFMGFDTVKAVIEAGKNIVDISFFSEDAFQLDELAKKHNVMAIVDCGVAPGISNMILGYHSTKMKLTDFKCYVGGLPKEKVPPFEYKAPFSPIDVIEEYIRPARFKQEDVVVIKEALSDLEILNFDIVGDLEAFNTDGLRSLLSTIDCPNMIEKTLRYPGHVDKIKMLLQAGFFSHEPLKINKEQVSPLQLTSKILFDQWNLKPGEEEFTILTAELSGEEEGISKTYKYFLYDEYDSVKQNSSMARTTGFTCTAVANLVLKNTFDELSGIFPPENIAKIDGVFEQVKTYLAERNVNIKDVSAV